MNQNFVGKLLKVLSDPIRPDLRQQKQFFGKGALPFVSKKSQNKKFLEFRSTLQSKFGSKTPFFGNFKVRFI